MRNLDYNLFAKQRLSFKDGNFKILMMSDFQETLDFNESSLTDMDKLVEKVKPDFVMLGGDNCNGLVLKKREEKRHNEEKKLLGEDINESDNEIKPEKKIKKEILI